MDENNVMSLPLTGKELDEIRSKAVQKGRVVRFAQSHAFAVGSATIELSPNIDGDDWELTHLSIDGANFGDGLTSYCEAFLDRAGLINAAVPVVPPFGIRLGSGYFGGYTPFMCPEDPMKLRDGDAIYLCVENGTAAEVNAMVEWELRRK